MEEAIIQTLSITNPFTQEQLKEGISSWPADLKTCVKRASLFKALRNEISRNPNPDKPLARINELCETLEPLLREPTDVEKEGYSQVHFQGNPWSGINSLPFALTIVSIYKSYIVPALGILLPLMSIILPFFLLVIFYNIPITFSEYSSVLWRIWNGQGLPKTPEDFLNPPPPLQEDSLTQLKRMAQNGWTLFTVGQTLWQPIQQARHFIKLDVDCLKLGESVLTLKNTCSEIIFRWKKFFPGWISTWLEECPSDSRQAFAFVLETPFWLRHTFRAMSRFELLYILGKRSDIVSTEFVKSEEPVLMIKDFGDSSIDIEKRVVSSIRLGGSGEASVKHSILTGPNRGGKSSFMRGILTNILVSHAFGCAFAEKAQMTHFSWIANGLRLDDTPGKQSMFEREVSFSSSVLRKKGGRGIVLYDELFHSTNPPDAIRSSQIFCNSLWKKKNCLSVVSTHVYSLAESAPLKLVKPICVAAWHSDEGFSFSYSVRKGICEVSSVDLVLKQYGMI